jgi:hypothetical protein
MPQQMNRLSVKTIQSAKTQGYYADGGGLYLQVSKWCTKSWVFRYSIKGITLSKSGKQISWDMGLGPLHTVSLAQARQKSAEFRTHLLNGLDPRSVREQKKYGPSFA